MPYITQKARDEIAAGRFPQNSGELNFALTQLINNYLIVKRYDPKTLAHGPMRYDHVNEVMGALECAKLELYRRVAAPYENKKAAENGDVYS